MKYKSKFLLGACLLAGMAMCLPLSACAPEKEESEEQVNVDMTPPTFETPKVVRYDKLPVTRAGDEPEFVPASKVTLHYHNDDGACRSRRFYTWVQGVDGVERKPDASTATDMSITIDFNDVPEYKGLTGIYFIIKVAGTWTGQSEDTFLSYTEFVPDLEGHVEIWSINGEGSKIEMYKTEAETKFPKIATAKFTDWNTIHCECSSEEAPSQWALYAYDKNYLQKDVDTQAAEKKYYKFREGTGETKPSFDIKLNYTAKINVQYVIESYFPSEPNRLQKVTVSFENLFSNATNAVRFNKFYTYSGDDLGMTYKNGLVTFKVWSPISARCALKIYSDGRPKAYGGTDLADKKPIDMFYTAGGVWELTLNAGSEDLLGKYYTFELTNSLGVVETVDPYVKAVGLNGLRGYIYDKDASTANPDGWGSIPLKWDGTSTYDIKSPQDLSIYEVHIRDLTKGNGWSSNKENKPGTFNAFVESGTTYTQDNKTVTTGFDHLTELGVKAVQIMPVFDHDDDEREDKMKFNWGYNPLNYNCVEGGYSSDPVDPLVRIKEYKNLVKAFANNENHTRVIMDVVYNHVSSATSSCFTKTMPKYYFRYDENWNYKNGSGCSNEVASEQPMMRKFITDSICWWATEYKIKGFRFDLMGLIDYQTMKSVKEAVYKIDPDIYLYGEGWTSIDGYGGSTDGTGSSDHYAVYNYLYNSPTSPGLVGDFNDAGRNALKGGNDGGYGTGNNYPGYGAIAQDGGYIGDKMNKVAHLMLGHYYDNENTKYYESTQCVNYASCHDNYTLYDQLKYTLGDADQRKDGKIPTGGAPDVYTLIDSIIACHGVIMMSNGVALMQGGEELYRTKTISEAKVVELNKGKTMAYLETAAAQTDETLVVRPYPWFKSWDEASWANNNQGPKPEDILASDEVVMYNGDIVSHNSYKLDDSVNAFDWSRKIEVDGKDVSGYNQIWIQMIHERNNLTRHGAVSGTLNIYGGDSVGYGATGFAIWNGPTSDRGYSFFFGAGASANIGIGDNFNSNNTFVFGIGYREVKGNIMDIGAHSFNVYKKGY